MLQVLVVGGHNHSHHNPSHMQTQQQQMDLPVAATTGRAALAAALPVAPPAAALVTAGNTGRLGFMVQGIAVPVAVQRTAQGMVLAGRQALQLGEVVTTGPKVQALLEQQGGIGHLAEACRYQESSMALPQWAVHATIGHLELQVQVQT